jgi:hypothetical protein
MHFQKTFYRYVGSASGPATVALGADSAPTTNYGTLGTPPAAPGSTSAANVDNILHSVGQSKNGDPIERLAVAMIAPSGSPSQLANLYMWDGNSQHWVLLTSSSVALVPNQVTFFDIVASADPNPTTQPPSTTLPGSTGPATSGNPQFMLVVAATGGSPSGVYQFVMTSVLHQPSAATVDIGANVTAAQGAAGTSPWPVSVVGGDLAYSSYDVTTGTDEGIIKTAAGSFVEMDGVNEGNSEVWIYLFNATAVPGNGSAIASQFLFALPVPAGQPFSFRVPKAFTTGLCWAASSTGNGTFTLATGATVTLHVEYQ